MLCSSFKFNLQDAFFSIAQILDITQITMKYLLKSFPSSEIEALISSWITVTIEIQKFNGSFIVHIYEDNLFSLQAYIIQKIPPAVVNLAYVQIGMGWFTGTSCSNFLMFLLPWCFDPLCSRPRIYIGFSNFFSYTCRL